ncbi:MAG TPA: LamG-like jellyroll fold domain-containing protein [Pirellulaceae bacterium]|nr:LamG-like jellyroll fold domain-containing protein [Pirellulaceae bacterium]
MTPRQKVILQLLSLGLAISIAGPAEADPPGLVGHWKLSGDVKDHSLQANHGNDFSVDLRTIGRDGKPGSAAGFDGRESRIEVANSKSLQLGANDFSIAMWVHTEKVLDDVLGDLLSKYDPISRRGFNFSIQNYAGVTSSQSNYRHLHFGIDNGSPVGSWTDHGRLGNAVMIFGMAVYEGQLFAGTCEAGEKQAGRVFRYDGETWTDCGSPDKCNAVSSLAVYDGQLYVGVSKYRLAGSALTESENPNLGGKIYRYDGDGRWVYCGTLPETEAINGMVVYRGHLYAGSLYAPAGFYRYEGGTEWTSCGTPAGKRVASLTVYNGYIYATGYDEGAVYQFDGSRWEHLGVLEDANQTYGFATHTGQLYVSEWPHAKVFRWGGGTNWLAAGRLGEEKETMPLVVYNGKMYAGTLPSAEVYRFDDPQWSQVGRLDFTPDVRYRRTWTMAVFQGRLFAGTLPSGRVHSMEVGRNVTYDHALPSGWVHLAAVRAKDRLRLHVNGKLVATSTAYDAEAYDITNDKPLAIGFGAHDYFNGKLSDVRLYGRALTTGEIMQIAERTDSP